MFNIRGEERGFLLWRDAILQVRFIVAHNAGVYILRVERESRFTFDRTALLYCVLGTKTIWFQKYFTENVLKPLLVHTFFYFSAHKIRAVDSQSDLRILQ